MKRQPRNSAEFSKPATQKFSCRVNPETKSTVHDSGRNRRHDETTSTDFDSEDEEETNESQSDGDSELDIDKPRIAQWDGEDEDESMSGTGIQIPEDKGEGSSKVAQSRKSSNNDISALSFGSLLKARRFLDSARVENDSDVSDDSDREDDTAEPERLVKDGIQKSQIYSQEWTKVKKPEKRPHKHAPIKMTSKRPVTRRRQVVEVKKVNYRDPRFSSLPTVDVQQGFQQHYSFLADMHKAELETLKENLKRARNMLRSSPGDRRETWEEEVNRLEQAKKRAESAVNKDRREAIERQALERVQKDEKERRKVGKGEWYMKKSERKDLLLKARHDALAETGGRLAVRKAIEKRQKKISQKEKRRRPSFAGRGRDVDNRGSHKRQKIGV